MSPHIRAGAHDGAVAVELAFVLPLLALLIFGTVQFGLAWHRSQSLQAAAREGARVASVGADYADVQTRVRGAQSLFDPADVEVHVWWQTASGTTSPELITAANATKIACQQAGRGRSVFVRARVAPKAMYAIVIPFWDTKQVDYKAEGAFRCERTAT